MSIYLTRQQIDEIRARYEAIQNTSANQNYSEIYSYIADLEALPENSAVSN